ncbi:MULTISPECIES: quinone-dependent dihydroorotate dehydrogenase [unclassified Siphonobacter]|uniref:quinone-dependent dihydroorotate dehydrogenase n=1 Tax=unclassified Siphonobacter TaxID=2635712 RepID=UPI000CB6865E|nr:MULTISPECIES: quinone-dependent dihydroorotate dehydrogenase [unclassified Siphonobacter]MDQ1088240.1 dihydroorotate dehydrogenase [Siphonobacter sp. SORGH_AS_1065]PKK37685.1 dihydroorotate dehydrogenase (quinone) [Siphonobacter sp. SORGH_AS_0500]
MYQALIRPILFCFDPEQVHYFTFNVLKFSAKIPFVSALTRQFFTIKDPRLEREVFGLRFPNPVGLAAGFDKNAELIDELADLGFGFIEMGTVTPRPQPGNDKPRLFRVKADQGIINRMGFNNKGARVAAEKLKRRKSKVLIGGNIGKNKVTPNENAVQDYLACFHDLKETVDYFVVNVSSPNTPNLRALQEKEPLTELLITLQTENLKQAKPKPILLKIAPDLTDSQLDDIIEIVQTSGIAGVIATNTTISRENLKTPASVIESIGAGGLSGKPVRNRSTEVIRYLHQHSGGSFPIIGVGGIHSPEDAWEKLQAGASLVQVYTGFIYEGPGLVKRICKYLLQNPA